MKAREIVSTYPGTQMTQTGLLVPSGVISEHRGQNKPRAPSGVHLSLQNWFPQMNLNLKWDFKNRDQGTV